MKQNIIERFLQIKDSKEKEILLDLIKQEKKKLEQLKDEDSFIRQTILDFIIIYNPFLQPKLYRQVSEMLQA